MDCECGHDQEDHFPEPGKLGAVFTECEVAWCACVAFDANADGFTITDEGVVHGQD
jgi:hypothetical protein